MARWSPRGTISASLVMWFVIYWQVRLNLLAFDLDLPLRATFLLVMLAIAETLPRDAVVVEEGSIIKRNN